MMTRLMLLLIVVLMLSSTVVEAQIPRFHFVGAPDTLTPYATLSLCVNGTVVINDGAGRAFAVRAGADSITPISGPAPRVYQDYNEAEQWYHRDGHWLAVSPFALSLSDSTGLVEVARSSYVQWSSFTWNDSIFVRRVTTGKDTIRETAVWRPGTSSLAFDTALEERLRFVHDVQVLTDGSIWLGGRNDRWGFTSTGRVEDADSGLMNNRCCPAYMNTVIANEREDSLIVLMRNEWIGSMFGRSYVVLALPKRDLRTYRVVQISLPEGFDRPIMRGHGQYGIGIKRNASDGKQDVLYVLDPDMQSYSEQPFEGIEENTILDMAYDPVTWVYYALTERGLYRSDPMVTSVAEDDQRPASEFPLQTSWYTFLGQHVEPPTTPGLYLKVEIDGKGQMVTEKVLIP